MSHIQQLEIRDLIAVLLEIVVAVIYIKYTDNTPTYTFVTTLLLIKATSKHYNLNVSKFQFLVKQLYLH